jgi:hypothetical protein
MQKWHRNGFFKITAAFYLSAGKWEKCNDSTTFFEKTGYTDLPG